MQSPSPVTASPTDTIQVGRQAIFDRDYPVVLGTLYLFTMLGLIAKLLADISYVMIDPRIHFDSVDN